MLRKWYRLLSNKLYCVEDEKFDEKKKAKGISSVHLKKHITHEDYKKCYDDNNYILTLGDKECKGERLRDPITSFRSIGLKTYTIENEEKSIKF